MQPRDVDLLKRLRERASGAFPRATADSIAEAEEDLGFRLPRLLRAVYRLVGNGGFGPGDGLIGVGGTEPYTSGHESVVALYDIRVDVNGSVGFQSDSWPEKLLPICGYGCASFACADCSRRSGRILLYDADVYLLPGEPFRKRLRVESGSLAEWFEEWLRNGQAR